MRLSDIEKFNNLKKYFEGQAISAILGLGNYQKRSIFQKEIWNHSNFDISAYGDFAECKKKIEILATRLRSENYTMTLRLTCVRNLKALDACFIYLFIYLFFQFLININLMEKKNNYKLTTTLLQLCHKPIIIYQYDFESTTQFKL